MTLSLAAMIALATQASVLGTTSQSALCIASSRLDLSVDKRAKPSYILGRFDPRTTGIAVRVINKAEKRAAVLFCLDASSATKVFAVHEGEKIGFSSTWRKIGRTEARNLKLDFEDYPNVRGDVLGMFWEGAGVAVIFWNGEMIEYRILKLRIGRVRNVLRPSERSNAISLLQFTGKERDAETGLDYFGARYMSSAQGRFTSVDPKGHSMHTIANPQKWNKYSYVLNNPLALVDPDGLEEVTVTYRTFIPAASVTVLGKTNGGDNRGFSTAANASHRTSISVRLETDPRIRPGNPIISVAGHAGASTTIENGRVVGTKTATLGLPTATGTRDANGTPIINIQQNTKNPEAPVAQALTPGITANLNVMVYQDASITQVSGTAAQFPASELNVTRSDGTTTGVIQYLPPTGATPWSLLRPERNVNEKKPTPACRSGESECPQ